MMEWLYEIWNLSLAASCTLLAVLAVRFLLRKAPKKYSCILWAAVFLRSVLPRTFPSSLSLFRIFPFLQTENGTMQVALAEYQVRRLSFLLQPAGSTASAAALSGTLDGGNGAVQTAAAGGPGLGTLLMVLWIAGMVLLLGYGMLSWLRIHRSVAFAVRAEKGVYESDRIPTAFVLGFFRPRIYLPLHLEEKEKKMVLAHEQAHLRRFDPQWKLLAWLITVLHWFNPCMWLAFQLLMRDMEMACDEQVLEHLDEQEKKEYGNCLLMLASPRHFPAGSPLAFGESSIKARIRNILHYRKGSLLAGMTALGIVLITLAACMSNPETEPAEGTANAAAEKFASEWAQAVASRDADAVYGMLSPELQRKAEELGIETAENGQRVMGWSSPFVPGNIAPVVVLSTAGDEITAEITYPAMTSDPLWWVWKDEISFWQEGDSFQVTGWKGRDYFTISSLKEFTEAYRNWFPDYRMTDETGKSFAEYLQAHFEEGDGTDSYRNYFSADTAAENTLHLSGGTVTGLDEQTGTAVVTYTWEDSSVRIDMEQPLNQGKGGVWIPVGWSTEQN